MLFSDVKTSAVDQKQQRTPMSILKCGTKANVGNVVMPPASVLPRMVSDDKPFQCPLSAQPGHPASGTLCKKSESGNFCTHLQKVQNSQIP